LGEWDGTALEEWKSFWKKRMEFWREGSGKVGFEEQKRDFCETAEAKKKKIEELGSSAEGSLAVLEIFSLHLMDSWASIAKG
jgi:hypothetical protein